MTHSRSKQPLRLARQTVLLIGLGLAGAWFWTGRQEKESGLNDSKRNAIAVVLVREAFGNEAAERERRSLDKTSAQLRYSKWLTRLRSRQLLTAAICGAAATWCALALISQQRERSTEPPASSPGVT